MGGKMHLATEIPTHRVVYWIISQHISEHLMADEYGLPWMTGVGFVAR